MEDLVPARGGHGLTFWGSQGASVDAPFLFPVSYTRNKQLD